jgi:hypothetical protein
MKDKFEEDFTLSTSREKKLCTNISKSLKYRKIQCLSQGKCTNLYKVNHKVLYKQEGILTCEGHVEKL